MGTRKTRPMPELAEAQAALTAAGSACATNAVRYECTLVTPMYGGGVKAGQVDSGMPIRATAIRGQLRRWWRLLNRQAANGSRLDSKALFEAERQIWGGLGDADSLAASKVSVRVSARPATTRDLQPAATYTLQGGRLRGPEFGALPGYVLFPAQGKSERGQITEQPKDLLKEGLGFTLSVHFDPSLAQTQREQVLAALRWWASFGGVGARTRRGCGAVQVKDAQGNILFVDREEVARQKWTLVLGGPCNDAMSAWKQAADVLRDYRQKPGFARNPGSGNRPGRSRWPEPDAIRRLTGDHASPHAPEHPAGNVFPRAAFGLPIITHFKQERDWARQDPQDTTLKPIPGGSGKPAERMASPLILRPYHNGRGWQAGVLCLDLDHVQNMGLALEGRFRGAPQQMRPGQWHAGTKADQVQPLQGAADAIQGFLAYFAEQTSRAPAGQASSARLPRTRTLERPNISKRGQTIRVESKGQTPREVTGEDATRLYQSLGEYARQRLDAGKQFNRLDITFDGFKFVSLKEHTE